MPTSHVCSPYSMTQWEARRAQPEESEAERDRKDKEEKGCEDERMREL